MIKTSIVQSDFCLKRQFLYCDEMQQFSLDREKKVWKNESENFLQNTNKVKKKIKQHFFEKRNYEWKGKKFSKDQKILFILFYFFLLGLCHAKKFSFQQNFVMAKKKVPSKMKKKKSYFRVRNIQNRTNRFWSNISLPAK